jgi:hypothetical protein
MQTQGSKKQAENDAARGGGSRALDMFDSKRNCHDASRCGGHWYDSLE